MKIKYIISILLSVALMLGCVASFPYLVGKVRADIFDKELAQRKEKQFSGVITVWQVDSFEGGVGSRTSWLNAKLSQLEKKYNGVYFSVKSVKPELLGQMLKNSKPDLISFGNGVFTLQEAQDYFDVIECPQTMVPSLATSGQGYAVPLFFGGYCILTDSDLANKYKLDKGLEQYINSDFGSVTYKKKLYKVASVAVGQHNTSAAALALYLKQKISVPVTLYDSDGLWDCYNYNYLCASAVCTQRQLYRLQAANEKNKGRKSTLVPLGSYTDMVQYISVFKGAPQNKRKIINNVIEYLTDQTVQLTVSDIGLMPAHMNALALIKYQNAYMQQLCDAVKNKPITVPGAFCDLSAVNKAAFDALSAQNADFAEFEKSLYR